MLRDAGLPANAVPPRLLLPIIENSSVEDNESLQELWAGLLATASQQTDLVSPSFAETLKQLTPDEAKHLELVYKTIRESDIFAFRTNAPITPYAFTPSWEAPIGVTSDAFERLGLIRREFDVKLHDRSISSDLPASVNEVIDTIEPQLRYQFVWTRYGINFLEACHGPSQSPGKQRS